jgi:3-phenylpropionate/trans-cinnamate dioxygenase ferredoxin subunit
MGFSETDEDWLDVCGVKDVPGSGVLPLRVLGRDLLVCRGGDDLFAVADRCTHAAWCLADSEIDGDEIACALHGGRFDLRTGEATGLPATKPLRTFPLRVVGSRVEVRVPPPVH